MSSRVWSQAGFTASHTVTSDIEHELYLRMKTRGILENSNI